MLRPVLLVIAMATLLSGCGFHLRGAGEAIVLPPVTLEAVTVSPELRRDMGRALKDVATQTGTPLTLTLQHESRTRWPVALDSAGKAREYELRYVIQFKLRRGNDLLLGAGEVRELRDLSFDEAQVLAKGVEEQLLYDDMRREAVQSVLRQVHAAIQGAHAN